MDMDSRFAGKTVLMSLHSNLIYMVMCHGENENNCRAWSSHDDSALFSLIQADYGLKSRQDFADALKNVSMRNKFHPVRELLDSLTWDGKGAYKRTAAGVSWGRGFRLYIPSNALMDVRSCFKSV